MKNRLSLHLKHDPALEFVAEHIRSVQLCTPLLLHYKHWPVLTWLPCLSNSITLKSSVLLLSKVGFCLWARGRDSGCWVCWSWKRKGEAGRRWCVGTCSYCENHQSDITTFPPEKGRCWNDSGCPGFFGSHWHVVDTENITMILFTRINSHHRDKWTLPDINFVYMNTSIPPLLQIWQYSEFGSCKQQILKYIFFQMKHFLIKI